MSDQSENIYEAFKARELEILRLINEGLNSREIAVRLVIGVETVRWYIKQIYSKLDVHSREEALERAQVLGLLVGITQSDLEKPEVRHNLPVQLTHFIGREQQIITIRQLLAETRLLTLTGPGGVGKTRLALHVVEQVADDFKEGVYFVGLASITDSEVVAKTIAGTLHVTENANEALVETLKRALAERELLLLIDNFEHVLEAVPLVSELLGANPKLKIVTTSREALNLYGEYDYVVPPLEVPDVDEWSLVELGENEAVRLFVQRARAAKSGFQLSDENVRAIVGICARLDGLPLAIELAAARCKVLTPQAILDRLQNRLQTLTGGARDAPARQRTLRATIDWSYELLAEDEKRLFARLSVFHGGRTLEAIETVCGKDLAGDVLDGLASLVDKSLVQQEEGVGGDPRFIMLETLHEYAYERLQDSGEAGIFHRQHAEYFVTLAEQIEPELHRKGQIYWLDRLDEEHDNLRTALKWLMNHNESESALRLVNALAWYWHMHSHTVEGSRWALEALDQCEDVDSTVRAKGLNLTGHRLLLNSRENALRKQLHEEAMRLARERNDLSNLAWGLFGLTAIEWGKEDFLRPMQHISEALTIFRELNEETGIGWALNALGELCRMHDKFQDGIQYYEEGLALFEKNGNHRGGSMILNNMAFLAYRQRQFQHSRELFQRAYTLQLLVNRHEEFASTLAGMAGVVAAQGEPERAGQLLAAADALLETMGLTWVMAEEVDFHRILSEVQTQLDQEAFDRCWQIGCKMSLDEALALAFSD